MIHQYKLGGYNIVLDVCSGSVHAVDEVAYEMIAKYLDKDKDIVSWLNNSETSKSELIKKALRNEMNRSEDNL